MIEKMLDLNKTVKNNQNIHIKAPDCTNKQGINEHYDEGNTIFQATCPVLSTDSPDDVAKKVHALEYEHFPQIIEQVLNNKN